jgi:hypothetical protein
MVPGYGNDIRDAAANPAGLSQNAAAGEELWIGTIQ